MTKEQTHPQPPPGNSREVPRRILQVHKAVLSKNDRIAAQNRQCFNRHGTLVVNLLSSPGSGKTALLLETLKQLQGVLSSGVIVGDLATDNDARRLQVAGAPVCQITTGTVCHLEAEMVSRALERFSLEQLELLIVENVGNLVCPASYDLGEDLRVVLFSVTEGEDKPLKYPPMFQTADAVVLTKMDLAQPCDFNRQLALDNIRRIASRASVFETSAKTGQGLSDWVDYLIRSKGNKSAIKPRD